MRRRSERRRRLLWAAVLLALVMSVAVLSVVDAGLRIHDHLVSATRGGRSKRKKNTVFRTAGLAGARPGGALVGPPLGG